MSEDRRPRSVYVFSPDEDVARSLALDLERTYSIVRVTSLEALSSAMKTSIPNALVLDLYTHSDDVTRLLSLVRERCPGVPIITLRGYIPLRKDLSLTIEEMSFEVLYKPVDAEQVSSVIHSVLNAPSVRT